MKDGRHVILYIDDDPDYLEAMRALLEARGYAMLEAASGQEGLAVFKREHPDLVIVDLMMEEVDAGTNLVKELRALGGDVPIFMLSSVGENFSMTTDTSELGLAGIFQKPIEPDTLVRTIARRLA